MPKKKKKISLFTKLFVIAIISGGLFLWLSDGPNEETGTPGETTRPPASTQTKAPQTPTETTKPTVSLPKDYQLDVAFTAQAPTGNWDELHNEACEEASVIIAWAYFNGITSLPPQLVEREITKLTEWQQTNYGYYLSITTPEAAKMAEEVYGLNAEVVDYTPEVVQQALTEDKLVILPLQGQFLNNPNFTAPGPPYHMLVVTGYETRSDGKYFITNDPGTRRGENYAYSFSVIEDAVGNYSHSSKEVNTNIKQAIIISK